MRKQFSIRSKSHNVYTISMDKIALNPFDDKRYIIKPECIDTLAWGHHKIDSEQMCSELQYVAENAQRMKKFMLENKNKK